MPENTPETLSFPAIFRGLVVALQPRALARDAPAVYAKALQRFPLDVLRETAEILAETRQFFPTTGEWARLATELQRGRQRSAGRSAADCPRCLGYGVIRINCRSGEPFDLAICSCLAAAPLRVAGDAFVRARFHLSDDHRVAWIEDFEVEQELR